jgi:hypothetical protein
MPQSTLSSTPSLAALMAALVMPLVGCKRDSIHAPSQDEAKPILLQVSSERLPLEVRSHYHGIITSTVRLIAERGTNLDQMIGGAQILIEPVETMDTVSIRAQELYGKDFGDYVRKALSPTNHNAITIHREESGNSQKFSHHIFVPLSTLQDPTTATVVLAHEMCHVARFQSNMFDPNFARDEVATYSLNEAVITTIAHSLEAEQDPQLVERGRALKKALEQERLLGDVWERALHAR